MKVKEGGKKESISEILFKEVMNENFPNMQKEMDIQI
jgi:predicted transcriptional regulator